MEFHIGKPDNPKAGEPLLKDYISQLRAIGKDPNEELKLKGITIEDLNYLQYPERYYVINNVDPDLVVIQICRETGIIDYVHLEGQKFDYEDRSGVKIHRNGRVIWFENYDNRNNIFRFVCHNGQIIDRKL